MPLFPIVSSLGVSVAAGNPFALATSPTLLGDGSDGDVVIAVDTTLTRDMQCRNLTVNAGVVLTTAGFKILVQETATIEGTVRNNGSNGTAGTPGAGGAGAPAGSTLQGGSAGGAGGALNNPGVAGTTSNPVLAAGVGGRGGHSATALAGGARGGVAGGSVLPILDDAALGALGDKLGGGGGGGGGSTAGNYGGGGGGGGGVILIAAFTLAGSGIIEANGGAGGNGNLQNQGGAGGGGGGGLVVLLYSSKTFPSANARALGGAAGVDTIGQPANQTEQSGNAGYVVERQIG